MICLDVLVMCIFDCVRRSWEYTINEYILMFPKIKVNTEKEMYCLIWSRDVNSFDVISL